MSNAIRPLIAGNWKMNGLRADGTALGRALTARHHDAVLGCELLVCPPATLLTEIAYCRGAWCRAAQFGANKGMDFGDLVVLWGAACTDSPYRLVGDDQLARARDRRQRARQLPANHR